MKKIDCILLQSFLGMEENMIIGIISDTHGLLRESVISHLENCDLIIHAGDIGKIDVIHRLEQISKVVCVKGNCDRDY